MLSITTDSIHMKVWTFYSPNYGTDKELVYCCSIRLFTRILVFVCMFSKRHKALHWFIKPSGLRLKIAMMLFTSCLCFWISGTDALYSVFLLLFIYLFFRYSCYLGLNGCLVQFLAINQIKLTSQSTLYCKTTTLHCTWKSTIPPLTTMWRGKNSFKSTNITYNRLWASGHL